MIHVQTHHPVHQREIYATEGSRRSKKKKRAMSRSPPLPPPSFRPPSNIRGDGSDRGVRVNHLLLPPPPPSPSSPLSPPSHRSGSVRGNNNDRGVHENYLPPPPSLPPSYSSGSVRSNNDDRGVHANHLLPPPSLPSPPPPPPPCPRSVRGNNDGIGVHANVPRQMLQSTRRRTTYVRGSNSIALNLNETSCESTKSYTNEIDFPILDRSDPSQLKFKPLVTCVDDNEAKGLDLSLRL